MFGSDRGQLRRQFVEAWEKIQQNRPLSELEALITDIIALHPEYHDLLGGGEDTLDLDWQPEQGETNPFLHMAMHIAIREQLGANRPAGIREVHAQLAARHGDTHAAEHVMLEALGETLWEAQRSGLPPDETLYLERLRKLATDS
ncbi:MAG: DUF1841 family protein [Gammaproteobacteria bacterium]